MPQSSCPCIWWCSRFFQTLVFLDLESRVKSRLNVTGIRPRTAQGIMQADKWEMAASQTTNPGAEATTMLEWQSTFVA